MRLRLRLLSFLVIFTVFLSTMLAHLASASPDSPGASESASPSVVLAASPPAITADYAAVIDEYGQVLYGKDLHHLAAPASLTKIVTALVALDKGNLSDMVKVNIDSKEFAAETGGTTMGLMPGEEISLESLLYGMMLPSANDAAITIAEYFGGGSQDRFAEMMNDKMRSLGLNSSHFVNPHGLDDRGHVSTTYEMAMLGRYAMQNPTFAKIVGTKRITIQGKKRSYNLVNVNPFVMNYPGADGVKTGYTWEAKNSIVATAIRNGRRIYVSLIRSDNLYGDSQKLADYFFSLPPTPTPTSTPSPTSTPVPTFTSTPEPSPTPTAALTSLAKDGRYQSPAVRDTLLQSLFKAPGKLFSWLFRTS